MVAAAAMAGVPLLNGFLSKEMFFAEAVESHDDSLARPRRCPTSPRWRACSASPIRCASSTASSSARRRPTCRARRTSRRLDALAGRAPGARLPRRRHRPGADHRPVPRTPRSRAVLGAGHAGLQPRGLARLHAAAAHERDRAGRRHRRSTWLLQRLPARAASRARRCCGALKGQRIFERVLVTVSWRWARAPRAPARHAAPAAAAAAARGASRCSPALWPLYGAGSSAGDRARLPASTRRSCCSGSIGGVCARRRGLAGEVPPACRAHADGRRRARHLRHLRLVLGARSRAHPARSSRSSRRC